MLNYNTTVRSDFSIERREFTLVNRTPGEPSCVLALYRFAQDYTLGKELLPYGNLFFILRHFKIPLSRVACDILDDGTAVVYDFSSIFDFVHEYYHAVHRQRCTDCGTPNDEPVNPMLRIAARNFIYCTERPKTKTYIVPKLQSCIIINIYLFIH